MSQLALAPPPVPAAFNLAPWAHDIRNTLTTVGLHLETLERLSGAGGRDVAHAAYALMLRAAAMCTEAVTQSAREGFDSRPHGFDIMKTIVQIANLLRPAAPAGFQIRVAGNGAFMVLANQHDVFRIVFNLLHNAISIARRTTGDDQKMTNVTLLVERTDATVAVRIADDGPGLPQTVRNRLFRRRDAQTTGNGMGLAIARELAERNGGVLKFVNSARGTTFLLELSRAVAGR
jgi:signal transduction histidine kinase